MEKDLVSKTFSSSQLSVQEIDNLYKQALKRIDVALFSARLDVISGSDESIDRYNQLWEQYNAVDADYIKWQASVQKE